MIDWVDSWLGVWMGVWMDGWIVDRSNGRHDPRAESTKDENICVWENSFMNGWSF